MNTAIEQMLKSYQIENIYDQKNAMKEIMQEIVLCGLSRAGFFQKAAFYGGTALRIFYGLDRFSEDLDFSLVTADPDFDLTVYFPVLEKEIRAFGLHVTIQEKEKTKESNIRSAFLKGNTKEHLLLFYADENLAGSVARSEVVKIKFKVDINPPEYAGFEHKYRLLQSGFISEDVECTLPELRHMLYERFDAIDFRQAKQDVEPFIRDTASLNMWNADFFKQITARLRF